MDDDDLAKRWGLVNRDILTTWILRLHSTEVGLESALANAQALRGSLVEMLADLANATATAQVPAPAPALALEQAPVAAAAPELAPEPAPSTESSMAPVKVRRRSRCKTPGCDTLHFREHGTICGYCVKAHQVVDARGGQQ